MTQPPLPVATQPQTPSLLQKLEQQSASKAHAVPSATQLPVVHTPFVHAPPPQSIPQPPQFCASLTRSEHTPSPQSTSDGSEQFFGELGAAPVHLPATQDCPTMHVCPHPPQS